MAVIENFSRYEFKFPVSFDVMEQMLEDLKPYVSIDQHADSNGCYTISSIYLENEDLDCFAETMNGVDYRQKVRLRIYGTNTDKSFIELKSKYNGLVIKRRAVLPLSEAMDFLRQTEKQINDGWEKNDIFTDDNQKWLESFNVSSCQILKEIQYAIISKRLKAKNVVSYERVALFDKSSPELRITFDFNIRTRWMDLDLAHGSYGDEVNPPKVAVLELKTGKKLPLWLVQIVSKYGYRNQTFSKYYSHYVKMLMDKNETLYGEYIKFGHAGEETDV